MTTTEAITVEPTATTIRYADKAQVLAIARRVAERNRELLERLA